jgi:RNA polymerase sigma-70 factor, ECF subfamily
MRMDRIESSYRRISERLWRTLFGYSGDESIASEAVAEAYTQALRRGPAIDDVDAWVWKAAFAIARGLLAQRTRDQAARPIGDQPGEHVDWSLAEFLDQLAVLSDQQRAVVVLRYVGGLQGPQIARLLDTTPATVRVQLHRAQSTLRAVLDVSR